MRILFINADGSGFADHLVINDNVTVGQLFHEKVPYGKPSDFLIRVNRLPAAADQLLQEGDRLSITPVKIEGAL